MQLQRAPAVACSHSASCNCYFGAHSTRLAAAACGGACVGSAGASSRHLRGWAVQRVIFEVVRPTSRISRLLSCTRRRHTPPGSARCAHADARSAPQPHVPAWPCAAPALSPAASGLALALLARTRAAACAQRSGATALRAPARPRTRSAHSACNPNAADRAASIMRRAPLTVARQRAAMAPAKAGFERQAEASAPAKDGLLAVSVPA
jgi:hypothetical protein